MSCFRLEISACIIRALEEDIGPGDATTNSIVAPDAKMSGQIIAKQAGVVAGLVATPLTFRLISAAVYGVGPWDPAILMSVAAALALICAVASAVPALRAARGATPRQL